jgi:site-specific recombinase XerC
MPRPRPPHLHREMTRHDRAVWYVRHGKGPRIRIRAEFGTPEFDVQYQAAVTGNAGPRQNEKNKPARDSLAWLVTRYRETSAWTDLALRTRRHKERMLRQVLEAAGHEPFARITKRDIVAALERREKIPFQARHFIETMRGLFQWAKEADLVKVDPTEGVKGPSRNDSSGYRAWTEDDVAMYVRHWSIRSRERVWLHVLLYTGLREGDATRLGRQHIIRDGEIQLKTEKTKTPLVLKILPPLATVLAAGPCGDLHFIVGKNGRPMSPSYFSNEFARAARAAGVNATAHGVRKLAAITAAYNGATVPQLNAIFGWRGTKMALHYILEADQRRLALGAMEKLLSTNRQGDANETGESIPAPERPVRASG